MSVRTRIDSDAMELDEEAVEEDIPLKSLRKNLMEDFGKSSTNLEVGEEHMKVFLRVRPFSEKEIEENQDKKCLEVQDDHTVLTHAPKESHTYKNCAHELGKTTNKFTFSKIFNERTSQKVFFNETMLDLVKNFIDGQNCLVFTYGVTSSGKTYTIQGEPKDAGILPRALDVLFNSINGKQWQGFNLKPKMFMDVTKIGPEEAEEQRKTKEKTLKMSCDEDPDVMSLLGDDASDMSLMSQGTNTTTCSESSNVSIAPNKDSIESGELFSAVENRVREETAVSVAVQGQIRFSVWVSFAEIYNEQIFDLLQPVSKKKNARRPVLKLSDDRNGSPYIKGLKEICVFTADEAYKLLTIGKRNLQMACTKLNHQSSRSHCIFNIKVLRVVDKGDPNIARVSMLSFCDLAGSERQSKTQSQGERLKEAGNINTSLLTLGRCIEMLRYNQHHKDNSKIIPFRDSKLTRLFQNFFNGRGRANMIVNVNQCASMFDETLHVFKFSAIAKQVVVPQKPVFKHRILPAPKAKPVKEVPRPSISWATPSQMKKMSSWISKGTNIPLPDDDDDDLEDQDNRQAIVELVEMVKQLEKEVAYERKEKLMLEMNIREQVCAEMMQQLVEMENDFSERLREREQIMEDFAERRIKILMDGLSATNQKPAKQDVMQDEDDEWVSSILFYQEQLKVQKKDKELEDMKKELEEVKSQLPQQKPQQETQNSTNQDCSGDMGNSVLLENLTRQLEEAKTQIREQATEITELNEMLTEAGETFQQKETEIGKLKLTVSEFEEKYNQQKETMTDLEKTLKEGHSSLELANTKILTKEEKVQQLEDERVKLQAEIQNLKNCVGFVEETLRLKEGEVGGWRAKLEREENESFKREQALINGYKAEISNLKQQIVTLKAETRQHSPMKSPVKSPTKRRLMGNDENDAFKEDLCRQLKDLQTEFDKNSSATLEMEHALSIARSASQDLEKRLQIEKEARLKAEEDMNAVRSKQSELQDEISEFKLEKDAVNNAENKKMKDLEKESEKIKEKFEKLQSAHEHLEKRYAEKIEEIIQVDKKVSSLEEELRNMAANHQTNAAEMHEKISDLTTELQEKETELESGQEKIEELQTVCQSLREMVNTATGEVQAKESALQVMSAKVEMEKTQKQENDSLGNLQQKMKMMKKECEEMKKASGEKDMEIERMRNQKEKDLEVEKTRKEKEKDVEFQLDEKNIEIMELTEKNFESEKKVLALENLVKEKIKQLSELNDEMDKMKVAKEMLEEDLQNLEENQENMEEIANTNIQMKQTLTEYETKNTTLEEEIVEIKEKMKELQRSLQAKCEECCKLQERWAEKEKEIVDVSKSCKQNMEDIEKQFIDLKSTCENLRTEMCEKCNHIERLENETKDLKKKIGDETFGHEKMEQELVELNGKFELKCADLEKVNTELETKNSDLSKVLSELEEMKSKSGNLEIEHEKLKSSIEDQVRELQKENSELKENLRMSELRVKELSEEVVREHVQLAEASSSCSQMQEKLENNSEQASELSRAKMSIAELRSSLHMHKTLHEKAKQEMAALKEEFDQLVMRKSDESNGIMEEKSVELNELQGRVTELMEERTQLEEKSKLLTDRDQQISAMETEMAKMSEEKQSLVGENERLQEEIESMKENIQFKEKDEQIELEKLRNEVDDEKVSRKEADNKIEKLESKLSSAREALQEKESRVTKLEKELLKLELDMAANVHNKVAELEKELDSEKEKNQRTFQETEEKHNLRMTEIVKELENQKNLLVAEKERCENYKKMVDDSQLSDCLSPSSENKTVRKLRKEKIEIENSLIQAKWQVQQLESKLKESENQPNASVSSELEKKLKKTMSELQEKDINNRKLIHDLSECHRKIENLECLKQELESKVQQKKAEVLQMSPKVSVLSEHLQRNPVPTSPTVHRELSLSQDRELTMKKQLQEASRNIAELSQKICDLDDQLMTKTKALVDAEDRIKTLQGGSAASRVSLTPSAELERLQEELSQKWDLIRDLQQDLSRKDQKLQDEAQRCKRLVNEMSEEKRKFETALSDANANEALIAHFKEALAEQEDTMSKQDVLIQQNEEEIRKLKQECDNYMMQYKSLLSGTSQSSKEIRDLSVQNARLTTDKEHLERCIKTKEEEVSKVMVEIDRLKEDLSNQKDQGVSAEKKELEEKVKAKEDSLQEMIKEKEKLNLIIQENNSELKEMEKALSESRSDCEKLRSQLDQNVSQQLLQTKKEHEDALSQMKTKIKDKDHSLRDSHKQVRQLEEELKKINDKVNDKETEMKTWKEEKDKLVQSLATIIEKQKADKTRVKELESEKTYMEEVLQDQVKTIQQLTAAKKSEDRRRKNPSGSSQPISPGSMNATISAIKQEVVETPGRRTSSRRGRKRRSVSESDLETPQSKRKGRESEISVVSEECADTSHYIKIDATPPVAARNLRKGRKKRSSVDLLREDVKENSVPKNTRASRSKSQRSEKETGKSLSRISSIISAIKKSPIAKVKKHLEEIKEVPSPNQKPPSSPMVEVEDHGTQMSAEKVKEFTASKSKRGKRHALYKEEIQISEPMDCGTFLPARKSDEDAHKIVKRQLRGRRH